MTPSDLAKAREIAALATCRGCGGLGRIEYTGPMVTSGPCFRCNGVGAPEEFAKAARSIVPALIAECERLGKEVAELTEARDYAEHALMLIACELEMDVDPDAMIKEVQRLIRGHARSWADDVKLAAKYAAYKPTEEEMDSVMSLLNWCREKKHEADSGARGWLERVVSTYIRSSGKDSNADR